MVQANAKANDAKDPVDPITDSDAISSSLGAAGDEIERLATAVLKLQNSLGSALESVSMRESDDIFDLQALDQHTQALEAIATFLRALATQSDIDWRVNANDAAQSLKLKDLASRLVGQRDNANEADQADSGDCTFF